MPLGSDNTVCKNEFVEAMRARLAIDDPALAATVDKPGAQKNLGAMGQAVFKIATEHAQTVSEPTTDAAFWAWVQAVNVWLAGAARWQQDVRAAFNAYAPATPAEQSLRNAILGAALPGNPPAPPTALRGKIV